MYVDKMAVVRTFWKLLEVCPDSQAEVTGDLLEHSNQ